jgi:hypothetical protein
MLCGRLLAEEPQSAVRGDPCMESDSGKRAKESDVRYRRYSIRHTFAAEGEMLELESGSRPSRLDDH